MTVVEPTRDRGWRTVPNLISLIRLLCVPVFVYLLLGADRPLAAGVLLAVLGATDWVDGWLARRFGGNALGAVLDPMADKALLVTMYVTLATVGVLPVWLAILVVLFRNLQTIDVEDLDSLKG